MTGQDHIIALRRGGHAPRFVWVNDFRCHADCGTTVSLSPSDVPEQQDWRFLVGLTAVIACDSEDRLTRITQSCASLAKRVIGNLHGPATEPDAFGYARAPVLKITDTQGLLTWQA